MHVNDDGTVAGSIDRAALEDVEPKTDEAKAQLDALKAEYAAGEEANARLAAARQPEESLSAGSSAETETETEAEAVETTETVEAAESDDSDANNDERDQLRGEAEALGVKVDGRWSVDRLRQEVEGAREG